MLMSVSTIVLNQILVAYGNAPVAAIGIVFKANMFITFLQMGLENGVQPLLYLLNACLGLNGVIYGQALTDWIAVIISILIWNRLRKKL